jgi:hypothetical protein
LVWQVDEDIETIPTVPIQETKQEQLIEEISKDD